MPLSTDDFPWVVGRFTLAPGVMPSTASTGLSAGPMYRRENITVHLICNREWEHAAAIPCREKGEIKINSMVRY